MYSLTPEETVEKIQILLDKKGKNVQWLIKQLGLGNSVYKYLNRTTKKIPSMLIAEIALVLDCDTDYLLLSDTTERKEISDIASHLGISSEAVHYIRSLKPEQKTGLDTVLCKRSGFGDLLQIFGRQKTFANALNAIDRITEKLNFNDDPSDFEITVFKASRITSKILEWIRH